MTDQEQPKKDLTGIIELSISQSAELPPDASTLSVSETLAPSPIDSFESIDELSRSAAAAPETVHGTEPMPEMPVSPTDHLVIEAPAPLPASDFVDKEPTLVPANPPTLSPDALAQVRNFSENAAIVKASTQVALPFSLRINGELETYEREKLLDLLSSHGTGISPVDLEPQFTGNKILIPRISEYTLVCIIQTLRGTSAQMRFGLSDSIYASDDTKEEAPLVSEFSFGGGATYADEDQRPSPAELIPVTTSAALAEIPKPFVLDTITASAALQSEAVEAKSSSEYQEVLDNLQKELKYKAFRRGATGVVNFTVQLTQLTMPSHYRLTVMGTAIRARTQVDPPTLPKSRFPSA